MFLFSSGGYLTNGVHSRSWLFWIQSWNNISQSSVKTLFFCKQHYLFSLPTFSFSLTMCLGSIFSQITVTRSVISIKHCFVEADIQEYGRNRLVSHREPRHSNWLTTVCSYLMSTMAHSENLVTHCDSHCRKMQLFTVTNFAFPVEQCKVQPLQSKELAKSLKYVGFPLDGNHFVVCSHNVNR